jgi:hypothetical protein
VERKRRKRLQLPADRLTRFLWSVALGFAVFLALDLVVRSL